MRVALAFRELLRFVKGVSDKVKSGLKKLTLRPHE